MTAINDEEYESLNEIVLKAIRTEAGLDSVKRLLKRDPEAGWPKISKVLPPEDRERVSVAIRDEFTKHISEAPFALSSSKRNTSNSAARPASEELASALSRVLDAIANSPPMPNPDESLGSRSDESDSSPVEDEVDDGTAAGIRGAESPTATAAGNGNRQPSIQHKNTATRSETQLLRYLAILMAIVLAAAFLWFVWPSRYRYDRFGGVPVRIERLTGQAEILTDTSGWVPLSEPAGHSHLKKLEPSELQRLEARCSIESDFIHCTVYNALSCTLQEVTITFLPPYPPRSLRLTREAYQHGDPLQATKFSAPIGDFPFFDLPPRPDFIPDPWWKITGGLAVCDWNSVK